MGRQHQPRNISCQVLSCSYFCPVSPFLGPIPLLCYIAPVNMQYAPFLPSHDFMLLAFYTSAFGERLREGFVGSQKLQVYLPSRRFRFLPSLFISVFINLTSSFTLTLTPLPAFWLLAFVSYNHRFGLSLLSITRLLRADYLGTLPQTDLDQRHRLTPCTFNHNNSHSPSSHSSPSSMPNS